MIRTIVTMSALVAATTTMAAAAETPALKPSGKWTVSYEPVSCVASRDFASPLGTITLAITPNALDDGAQLAVIAPDAGAGADTAGRADLVVGGITASLPFTATSVAERKMRIARSDADASVAARIATSPTVTVPLAPGQNFTFPTAGYPAALKATDTCRADLRKKWRIDPDAFARIATPATAIRPERWIMPDDYPVNALNDRVPGEVTIVWTITPGGRAADCRVVEGSGRPDLDRAACVAVAKRARYRPALDKAGKPVTAFASQIVRWRLPR